MARGFRFGGAGSTSAKAKYIFKDGVLEVPISALNWYASGYSSGSANSGSVNISGLQLKLHKNTGNPGYISWISDSVDLTGVRSIDIDLGGTGGLNLHVGVTTQYSNGYTLTSKIDIPDGSSGHYSVDTSQLSGNYRFAICGTTSTLYSYVDVTINEIKLS